jgi:hypothetical protein
MESFENEHDDEYPSDVVSPAEPSERRAFVRQIGFELHLDARDVDRIPQGILDLGVRRCLEIRLFRSFRWLLWRVNYIF